jgi:N-acetylated-alpha-linked acidic dipeptidase
MRKYVAPVERGMTQKQWSAAPVAALSASITKLEQAAAQFATARDAALAAGATKAQKDAANAALLTVERGFARGTGLKSRPWYRSMIYASDVDNGYSTMVFPGVNEAIRYGTEADVKAELTDLVGRFDAAAAAMDKARTALGAR